jgi:hypothetical protein
MKGGFLPYKIVILILVLSCSCLAQAQSKKQVRLEERRKEILVEIRQINTLLAVSKQKKKFITKSS